MYSAGMSDKCCEVEVRDKDCVCEHEMSTCEILRDIRKELNETLMCLSQIKLSIDGEGMKDRSGDEPGCMHDEVKCIEHMAMDCVALSHVIHDKLFRRLS